jgi:uncharacterized protein (DUF885 family)
LVFGALSLGGCENQAAREKARAEAAAAEGKVLAPIVDDMTRRLLQLAPEQATSLAVDASKVGGHFQDRLSDASGNMEPSRRLVSEVRSELGRVRRPLLSASDQITYDVATDALAQIDAGLAFSYGNHGASNYVINGAHTPYVVSQLTGAYQSVPDFLDSRHPLQTKEDADDYLRRLRAFADVLSQETLRIQVDASAGIVPPHYIIDRTLQQMRALALQPAPTSRLVRTLNRLSAAKPRAVGPTDTADYIRRAIVIVREDVQPALRSQMAALEKLRAGAGTDPSVQRLPQGQEFYRTALAAWTTTDLSPDEIHQMGLDLVDKIEKEMDTLLRAQGYTKGTAGERLQAIARDPAQLCPNTEAAKARVLVDFDNQAKAMTARLPSMFGVLPKAALAIRRVPPEIQAGAPLGYYQPAATDGSRPGTVYINLRDSREFARFSLPTLNYHEGVPGHHLQVSIAQETGGLPLLRSAVLWYSGYGEGWALYAEQLADEMGVYADDPLGRLGYLQSVAFRAARLVVDTGLHAKGWSREKAIDYMVAVTGDQRSALTTEVERYIVWPGQACAYMVGRQQINRLRDAARAELGSRFDIRAFHDRVLQNGALPLSILDADTKAWIAARKAAKA